MRRYLLDTPLLTAYLRGRPGAVALMQPWIDASEAATSVVVYGEVIEHFKSLPDFARRQTLLRALLRQCARMRLPTKRSNIMLTSGVPCAHHTAQD